MINENQIISEHWSEGDGNVSDKSFYTFPPIRARSCQKIFNETDASREDWCEYWTVEKFLKNSVPFENALSICSGFGHVERFMSKFNVAKNIVGTDLAQGAINVAKEKAKEENLNNIQYFVTDLNTYDFPENIYDLIWANGALHHIKNLERVIPGLYKSLKPGGYLVSNEYVGTNYQQVGLKQQAFINAIREIMPKSLFENNSPGIKNKIKKRIKNFKNKYHRFEPRTLEWFMEHDPSEGVNSENIIPILRKTFDQVEIKPFGGSVLFYAFDHLFYNNFDFSNKEHMEYLDLAFSYEDGLLNSGVLASDNAHLICRKKS